MTLTVRPATDARAWDTFLAQQRFRPFLQSWTMGDVYADIGQTPVRIEACVDERIVGICFGHIVPARRGKHIAVPYGPIIAEDAPPTTGDELLAALCDEARRSGCTFVRYSPFRPQDERALPGRTSPLHLLAEHIWYLPLQAPDPWTHGGGAARTEEELLADMRKTTRNLVRRAERDGITVAASENPVADLGEFIRLHDETRKRHGFTPYTNAFFRSQVARFAPRGECSLYLARFEGQVIAAAVHMHAFGETSYHHGASSSAHAKLPASYILQWTAIRDALKRGDRVYSFWGIAPVAADGEGSPRPVNPKHPFAGVTLFKTGFGGALCNLTHCRDIPLSPSYAITRAIETVRKWRRGF